MAASRNGPGGADADWQSQDPHHRHISHLIGLYPGNLITEDATPGLFAARKRALDLRGDESTGWSMAWKVNWGRSTMLVKVRI